MLLDYFMPDYHFREYHQALALAPAQAAFQSVLSLDMSRLPLVQALLSLRALPWRLAGGDLPGRGLGRTMPQMQAFGFIVLAHDPPRELVLGLVGRFWSLRPQVRRLSPQGFRQFSQPGFAMVAANFLVRPLRPGLVRLSTETRVRCLGPEAKNRFRRYWTLIRPFSGFIRREWLRVARQEAEAAQRGCVA